MAFADYAPINEGHLLVAPVAHAESLAELDGAAGAAMFRLAQRCAAALRTSGLRCDGVNVFLNDGEAAGQAVPHVHLHVVPRFPGDDFLPARPERKRAAESELAAVAARVRAQISV